MIILKMMSDGTSRLPPDHSSPPFSDELPKDTELKISVKVIIEDEIGKVEEDSQSHPLEIIPRYPELHILALFANLAYQKAGDIPALIDADGWQLFATAESPEGYFGAVFWHPANHQIVIAHRGTDFWKFWNDIVQTDIRGVYFNKYVYRMSSAATFAEEILLIFEKVEVNLKYPIDLFFTGHSLGGWLAQITTFTIEYLRPMMSSEGRCLFQNPSNSKEIAKWNYHAHTVVFESPGCASMLRKMRNSFNVSSRCCSTDLKTLDITNYVSAPNVINTCNDHVGTCYRLITDLSDLKTEEYWYEKYIDGIIIAPVNTFLGVFGVHMPDSMMKYTLITHSIDKIEQLLNDLIGRNPDYVKKRVKKILDWPTLDAKKDYEKLIKEDILNWTNHYHLDPSGNRLDDNGLYPIRYQTEDFDELSGNMSMFTPSERECLKRYVWMRDLGLSVFQPDEWFGCIQNSEQEKRAKVLLNGFSLGRNKFRSTETPDIFVPFVKSVLKLYPSINIITQKSLSAQGIVKKIFQFESRNYHNKFERKWNALDVDEHRFGPLILEFLNGKKRILHAIGPEERENDIINMAFIHGAVRRILQSKNTSEDLRYTILNLKRFLNIMQHGIEAQHIFGDAEDLLIIYCKDFELDNVDQELLGKLLVVAKHKESMKLILVSNSELGETMKFLIEQHQMEELYLGERLPSLNCENLAQEYKQKLLSKRIRLAGSPDEMPLLNLLGTDLELETDAMMQLIKATNVIDVGHEPQRLSDLEAAYSRCSAIIAADNLCEKLLKDASTVFIIDGFASADSRELIESLGIIDDEKAAHLRARVSTEDQVGKNIKLISGEYSEHDFKQFCRYHSTHQIQWFSFKLPDGWHWNQLYDPTFYVERELYQVADPKTISLSLKKEDGEYFVVKGIEEKELLNILNIKAKQIKTSSRLSVVENFEVVVSTESNLNKIVHYLAAVKNGSSIHRLVRQVLPSLSADTGEEFAALKDEPLSIIVDHPGMGKSTTLTRLAEKRMYTNWVIRLNLKDCSSHLIKKGPDKPNLDDVIDFFWIATGGKVNDFLAKAIFKYHLKNCEARVRPLLLLLDGFDEIQRHQQKKIIAMLKVLQGKFANSKHQVVITTRRHPKLEKDLGMMFTVEFTVFDRKNQIQFLKNLWFRRSELHFSDLVTASAKSERYAEELLNKADTTLKEKMAPFIGIPMQLRLLMEGFHGAFLKYVNSRDNVPIFNSISILNIYEYFIKAKYDLLLKEKTGFSEISCPIYEKWVIEKFARIHQHKARGMLFPKSYNDLFSDYSIEDDEHIELYRLGLIQRIRDGEGDEFIHLTFVDYFAADLLMRKLPQFISHPTKNRKVIAFFIDHVLSKSKYQLVRNFLDEMLFTHRVRMPDKPLNKVKYKKKDSSIFLHVAVNEGKCNIIRYLLVLLDKASINAIQKFRPTLQGFGDLAPLHLATKMGNTEVVQQLLSHPFTDVYVKTSREENSLHIAAEFGHLEILKLLLNKIQEKEQTKTENFAINAKAEPDNMVPLHLAVKWTRVEVVQILLRAKNIDVNAKGGLLMETPLHLAVKWRLHYVKDLSSEGDTMFSVMIVKSPFNFRYMILNGANKRDKKKINTLSPHCKTEICKRIAVIQHLLQLKETNVNARNVHNMTPLHVASQYNNYDAVKTLLSAKNVDFNAWDEDNKTPLHLAAQNNSDEAVRELLSARNVEIDARDRDNMTPLHLAAKNNSYDVVRKLISSENVDVNARNNDNMTPLHLAAKNNSYDVVRKLLSSGNADVNARDKTDKTPLHLAAENNSVEAARELLSAENVDLNARDEDNMTPLHLAAVYNFGEATREFLSAKKLDVNARDSYNMTPLHLAAQINSDYAIRRLLSAVYVDVDARDNDNKTPLHLAAETNSDEAVRELISAEKVDVNARDKDFMTPLHLAARNNSDGAVRELLLAENVDVNARDNDNTTPLHLAAKNNSSEAVHELLLAENVDVNAKGGHDDKTPRQLAVEQFNMSIAWIFDNHNNEDNMKISNSFDSEQDSMQVDPQCCRRRAAPSPDLFDEPAKRIQRADRSPPRP